MLRTESLTELSTEDLAKRANDAAADVRDFGAATSAGTILQRALNDDEIVHDGAYADALAGAVQVIYSTLKSIVPRDLQYRNGRKSSIFDKG